MKVTVLGAGKMAAALGARLAEGGHEVCFLGRDAAKAAQLADRFGAAGTAGTIGEPLGDDSPVVVIAVRYPAVAEVLGLYGEEGLGGKTVVDLTNPLNAAYDGLLVEPDSSAAELVATLVPSSARVVKAFNTTFDACLAAGVAAGVPLDVFIAGDDAAAKAIVAGLVKDGGMRPVDVGELFRARALENFQLLHIMAQKTLETGFRSQVKLLS